jgi:hypothetical protein
MIAKTVFSKDVLHVMAKEEFFKEAAYFWSYVY